MTLTSTPELVPATLIVAPFTLAFLAGGRLVASFLAGRLGFLGIPEIVERTAGDEQIRVWVPGCATGQEPYSIAIEILRVHPRAGEGDVRVLATDAIFHWRLTGKTRRLSHHLAAIDPASRTQQSADAARRTIGGP